MLTTLVIKDFAIISELELSFDAGFSVLTGETGAGKSIIVSALGLLLGGKASIDVIRTGADQACVEGLFTVDRTHAPTMAMLESIGINLDDDEFVVRRTVSRKGRGKIFIGGTLQSLTTLRNLMRTVIDISGQHEHVSLLDESRHLSILDQYAGTETDVDAFAAAHAAFLALKHEHDALLASLQERAKKLDFLNYQLDELHHAAVKIGESQNVSDRLKHLSNIESLQAAVDGAVQALYDNENSIVSSLGSHIAELNRAARNDKSLTDIVTSLKEALNIIKDCVSDLRHISLDASPAEIEVLQERLSVIDKLERKYRVKADDIPNLCLSLEKERDTLVLSDERILALRDEMDKQRNHLINAAHDISTKRSLAAQRLSCEATNGLHLLSMEHASFNVECHATSNFEHFKNTGADDVRFTLCPNPGEDPRSLSKIASGGELSRVLLAIKRAVVEKDDVACYIFDEVDTGIGGQTATHVAQMLREVSKCHQVLCITHLASIACYADFHFQVSKSVVHDRTQSQIRQLNDHERVEEIARMLGGSITQKTLAHAAEMIHQAQAKSNVP